MTVRRRAFWRGPNGQPVKDNYDAHSPTHLLERLAESSSTDAAGSTVWDNLNVLFDPAILRGRLFIDTSEHRDIPETDLEELALLSAKDAISIKHGTKSLASQRFLKALDERVSAFLAQKHLPYILRTTLSVTELPHKSFTLGGCRINSLSRSRRPKLPLLAKQHFTGTAYEAHAIETRYLPISVHTSGRSTHEAAERALESLSLLRALWTFHSSFRQKHLRFMMLQPEPFSHVHSGPIHALNLPNGRPATDTIWYEPYYTGDQPLFRVGSNWATLTRFLRDSKQLLRTSPYQPDLERAFRRYIAALDKRDPETSFVNLWGVLEMITQTGDGNYDKTIQRASWMFSNRALAAEELKYLRMRRNRIVHASAYTQDGASSVSQLKSVIDAHLRALLHNPCKVTSLAEYAALLDLPTEQTEVIKRRLSAGKASRLYSHCVIRSP